MKTVEVLPFAWGYEEGLARQHALHDALAASSQAELAERVGYLMAGEHEHVYTLGKHGHNENMLLSSVALQRMGVKLVQIDRGGDITYHGPGQLVGYPILHLPALGIGARAYVERLLESVQRTCELYGVACAPREDAPGLWLGGDGHGALRKICAVGVHIGQGVSTHGFALNVNTDLGYFSKINPCGFSDRGVTSLAAELGHTVDYGAVQRTFLTCFAEVFGVALLEG